MAEFKAVDAAKWERIKAAVLAKAGMTIKTDAGTASAKGITLSWAYTATTQALDITLLKRSFYDPSAETIAADIEAWIGGA